MKITFFSESAADFKKSAVSDFFPVVIEVNNALAALKTNSGICGSYTLSLWFSVLSMIGFLFKF